MDDSGESDASDGFGSEPWLDVYGSYTEEWADWQSQVKMCAKEYLASLKDHLFEENNTFSSLVSWLHIHASEYLQLYAYIVLADLVSLDDQGFQYYTAISQNR